MTKQENTHVCPTCQKPTSENGHLCVPVAANDKKCDWCGSLIINHRHLCKDKLSDISYICNSCGRTAVQADLHCSPEKIE